MLNFHVTKHVYNDIIKGIKRHEYREHKPYWINRLAPVFPPLFARIYLGYSNTYLDVKITKIKLIETKDIKNPLYKIYIKTKLCYDLTFEVNN